MAGHAQFKFVMTECSKTRIRLTGLKWLVFSWLQYTRPTTTDCGTQEKRARGDCCYGEGHTTSGTKPKDNNGTPSFYAPPPESGGVLCYTLRNFECPSVCLSVRPSVRPSVSAHHHSCIGNSSYSFRPILLKLYRCFKDGLKICILFFQNPEIIFYHFFPIFNLDIFRALILQICIWSMYLVSATPPTVFGESFWNFTGVLRMVWGYAYCFFRILKLFFITFFAFLT